VGIDPTVGLDAVDSGEFEESNPDSGEPENQGPIDSDGDGVPVEEDCDDSNASIYPGAVDVPNDGIDQDCDQSDAYAEQLLSNPTFDQQISGRVANWQQLGGTNSWQGDGTPIRNSGGNTGSTFVSRSSGGGALKIWGDYGTNPIAPGQSAVLQEFIQTGVWSPGEQQFWFDGWAMVHDTDLLQGTAQALLSISCIRSELGSWVVQNEFQSQPLTSSSSANQWLYLYSEGVCDAGSTTVRAEIRFEQDNIETDHGAVYFEDMFFGVIE